MPFFSQPHSRWQGKGREGRHHGQVSAHRPTCAVSSSLLRPIAALLSVAAPQPCVLPSAVPIQRRARLPGRLSSSCLFQKPAAASPLLLASPVSFKIQ